MDDLKEAINELIDDYNIGYKILINDFFNLLFWKDFHSGHVDIEDKHRILEEIGKAKKRYHEDNFTLDTEKILPFINKIRKQIGLPELTLEIDNMLMEIDDSVRKELILRRLK